MTSERALWKWLRRKLPRRGHYTRIESESSWGFPDVNYCLDGIEGTIELKCSRYPKAKQPFKRGGLRDSQIIWIRDRDRAAGKVWLIFQVGKEHWITAGRVAIAYNFNNWTKSDIEDHSWRIDLKSPTVKIEDFLKGNLRHMYGDGIKLNDAE